MLTVHHLDTVHTNTSPSVIPGLTLASATDAGGPQCSNQLLHHPESAVLYVNTSAGRLQNRVDASAGHIHAPAGSKAITCIVHAPARQSASNVAMSTGHQLTLLLLPT